MATFVERFLRWWLHEGAAGKRAHAAFLCCLALICGSAAYIGVPWIFKNALDVFVFLDGGWRALNGQRAHVDFYTAIGPVTYLINAAGLQLAHLDPRGLGIGTGLFGFLVGLAGYRIALPRLRAPAAALCGLLLALIVVSPFSLGEWPTETGLAMLYNRYGYGLFGIILTEVCKPVRGGGSRERRETILGAISIGVLCGLLFFLKVTFFLGALPLILFGWSYRSSRRREAITAAGLAFLAVCAGFLWYLKFDLAAMWHDLLIAALSRHAPLSPIQAILSSNFDIFGLLVLLALLRAADCGREVVSGERARGLRQIAVTGLVVVMSFFLLLTNAQRSGLPLAALLAILLADEIQVPTSGLRLPAAFGHAAIVAVAFLVALPTVSSGGISLGYSVFRKVWTVRTLGSTMHSPEPSLAGLLFTGEYPPYNTPDYLRQIEDGMALLRARSEPAETVFSVAFTNPFSFGLRRPPAKGGAWSLAYHLNFDERYHPSPEQAIGGADIIMEPKFRSSDPKYLGDYYPAGVRGIYGVYLQRHFRLVAESSWWFMYRRLPGSGVEGMDAQAAR